MIEQCVEGGQRFGMVGRTFSRTHGGAHANHAFLEGSVLDEAHTHGCEVEIVACQRLPGGRFHVEVVGRRSFKVAEKDMSPFGYMQVGGRQQFLSYYFLFFVRY